jgi:uncharacterized membrane protein YciS (DUF1049 family)
VIRWGLIVVLTVSVLVVASENRTDLVMLQMLFGFRTPPFSLGLLVLLSFAAGIAVMTLWLVPAWVRASLLARRQRRQIEELEGQPSTGSVAAPSTVGTPPHDFS